MAWCVDTLKIVGEGKIEKSNLCNFELDLGYYDNFVIINEKFGEVIKIIIFPEKLFEKTFLGENIDRYTMHFIKYKEGQPWWITEEDIRLIAKEYHKRSGKKLKLIEEI
ncbi:hypothetical protein ABET41_10805 [Metabacillus fastidiosus]|uniref:Uncharacterized protein n=1 Tax=Metabacillus fastidiosus TaxID=1458 RepID=A0ABU6NSJ1_9BACI|nr:hypothetical protein [Metabacillus fastidiosus]